MLKNNASSKQAPGTDWAQNEFASAKLPDQRLVDRLIIMGNDFAQLPTASIPQACRTWGKTQAAYRFCDNDRVDPDQIIAAHAQATLERVCAHPVVLCAQDTTTLNYSTHPQTSGLGPISNNRDKTIGLFLHSTLAMTAEGQPLGLLHAKSWRRLRAKYGRSSNQRNRTPRTQKESQKWMDSFTACQKYALQCPKTLLVNVADREGDLYDLFVQALAQQATGPRAQVLVRAQHNRQVAHPQKYLWDFLAAQPLGGHLKIKVPRKNGRPERIATLSIRFARVTLRPPCLKEDQEPLTLWAIEARESRPPKGVAPICWRLLTTLPVVTFAAAVEKVRWYARRWLIEIIHKIIKSGCKIEQRQLETARRLQRVAMLDLVVAWRVLALCKGSRETPEGLASDWLIADEWLALGAYFSQSGRPPKTPPSLRQAVRWIAQLGGFLGRRSDGEPGPIVVWRGLQHLCAITAAWRKFGASNCV